MLQPNLSLNRLRIGLVFFLSALVLSYAWSAAQARSVHLSSTTPVVTADKKGKDKKDKKDKKDSQEKEDKTKKEKNSKKSENSPTAKTADKKPPLPLDNAASTTAHARPKPAPEAPAVVAPTPPLTPVPSAPPLEVKPAASEAKANKTNEDKAPPSDEANTFRFNSNLVAVPVSVTDANGEPIRNLKAEEFRLDEEGQAQQVQSLGEPGKTPLDLTLLFDISGSVFERFDFQKQAASRFLQQVLKPNDVVSVFLVGFEGRLVIPRTRNFPKVISEMMALQPSKEGTAFHASVVKAAQYLNDNAESGSRRVMVVISDGEDNYSKTVALSDAQRELQRSDIVFYSINPSGPSIKLNRISMRGQNAMLTLANETGGVAFLPDNEENLEHVFRQIAAELQAQYLLGYYSTNEANDGNFRRIKIQLPRHTALRIRARQGYYAPKE